MEATDIDRQGSNGSLSLEAAIVIPLFCFLIFGLVSILQHFALYFVTANACVSGAEKLSADACIFYEMGLDSLDDTVRAKILNVLPDTGMQGSISSALAGKALDKIESTVFEAVMKEVIHDELNKELRKAALPFDAEVVTLLGSEIFEKGNSYKLCVRTRSNYLFPNVFTGEKGVTVDYVLEGNAWICGGINGFDYSGANVWAMSVFKRGKAIEKEFGSNLPEMFPVIDRFDSVTGECVMIVSIDYTAPTYSNREEVRKRILSCVNDLVNFRGGECEDVLIKQEQILKKKLLVVLPDNEPDEMLGIISRLGWNVLRTYNVNVVARFYQHSYVYEENTG